MEDFNYAQRQAIRAWTVEKITLILNNNDRRVRYRLQGAASEAIAEGMGTGYGREDYERDLRNGNTRDCAVVVGIYVEDELRRWLDQQDMPEIIRTLLMELLDLGDSAQREMLGDHYLPDVDDVPWDEELEGGNDDE